MIFDVYTLPTCDDLCKYCMRSGATSEQTTLLDITTGVVRAIEHFETLSICSLLGFCKNSDHVCNPSNLSKLSKSRCTSITTIPRDYIGLNTRGI
jgi:hypothetical protein